MSNRVRVCAASAPALRSLRPLACAPALSGSALRSCALLRSVASPLRPPGLERLRTPPPHWWLKRTVVVQMARAAGGGRGPLRFTLASAELRPYTLLNYRLSAVVSHSLP